MALFDLATVLFIITDYTVPALIAGVMLAVQPIIRILASRAVEKHI